MNRRIGIDFHVVNGKYQGSRTHVIGLFSRAVAMAPDVEFFLFLDRPEVFRDCSPAFASPNVQAIRMEQMHPIKRLCFQLPKMQRKYALDLLHTQYTMPIPSLCPCVVTIHDVLFESHPQYFSWPFRARFKILISRSVQRARHLFTVSQFSKSEIVNRYGVDPGKITVILNAVDTTRFFPGKQSLEILQHQGLRSNEYILTAGRLEPRKNHLTLLRAYTLLGVFAPPLVIVGQPDFGYHQIHREVDRLGMRKRVKFLSDVGDEELPILMRHAALFVYPSWAEGFGIPPLEAMASGVPVICSNTTSLPEVAGNAAFLINPNSIEQLADGIRKILGDADVRRKMRETGLVQARKFSWEIAAQKTLEGYKIALE